MKKEIIYLDSYRTSCYAELTNGTSQEAFDYLIDSGAITILEETYGCLDCEGEETDAYNANGFSACDFSDFTKEEKEDLKSRGKATTLKGILSEMLMMLPPTFTFTKISSGKR